MKIIQDHSKCIGCLVCVSICPEYWEQSEDGKVKPVNSKLKGDKYEVEVAEEKCNKSAADSCPVQCIVLE